MQYWWAYFKSIHLLQTKHQRAELSYLVDRPRRVNR